MALEPTNIPISGSKSDCGCPTDPKILFGPVKKGEQDRKSKRFQVTDKPVLVEAFGLEPFNNIKFERYLEACGHPFTKPAVDLCGNCIVLGSTCTQAILTVPGWYCAEICGDQDPADIVVQQCEIEADVTISKGCKR